MIPRGHASVTMHGRFTRILACMGVKSFTHRVCEAPARKLDGLKKYANKKLNNEFPDDQDLSTTGTHPTLTSRLLCLSTVYLGQSCAVPMDGMNNYGQGMSDAELKIEAHLRPH